MVCDGRITGEGLKSLLTATQAKAWLFADDRWTLKAASVHDAMTREESFPSLKWCLDADGALDYPYNKTWEEAKDDEILIIHTSGTTGEILESHIPVMVLTEAMIRISKGHMVHQRLPV